MLRASMRPALEGAGNWRAGGGASGSPRASMRPALEGAGNATPERRAPSRPSRFNEARARRRGKFANASGRGRRCPVASMRPALEGAGNSQRREVVRHPHPASMRPALEGAGNGIHKLLASKPHKASMRPALEGAGNMAGASNDGCGATRFNEARARRRGKFHRRHGEGVHPLASMRPALEGAGNCRCARLARAGRVASMRPALEGAGNIARVPQLGKCHARLQ